MLVDSKKKEEGSNLSFQKKKVNNNMLYEIESLTKILSLFQQHLYWILQTIKIANIYVSIMYICHKLVGSIICGSNIQHKILDFHRENRFLRNNKCQGISPKNMLEYLVNIYGFGA